MQQIGTLERGTVRNFQVDLRFEIKKESQRVCA
jgi:hypothetical protein